MGLRIDAPQFNILPTLNHNPGGEKQYEASDSSDD